MADTEGKRTTFGAFLVFETRQADKSKYEFRLHPTEDMWVTVDMTNIPANLKPNENPEGIDWEDIDIDAGSVGCPTRLIGWEKGTNFGGVIYLSERYMQRSKHKLSLPPPGFPKRKGGYPMAESYEFNSVLYSPDAAGREGARYYGFHARITKERDDGQVLVSVYHAGASQDPSEEPARTFWVDLDESSLYDFSQPLSIGKSRKEGALFVERTRAKTLQLRLKFPAEVLLIPKEPRTLGVITPTDIK